MKPSGVGSNTIKGDFETDDKKKLTNVSLETVPKFQSLRWFLQHAQVLVLATIAFLAGL